MQLAVGWSQVLNMVKVIISIRLDPRGELVFIKFKIVAAVGHCELTNNILLELSQLCPQETHVLFGFFVESVTWLEYLFLVTLRVDGGAGGQSIV